MIDSVYFVAAGRSGSTLLDRLLGTHPDALAVGEVRHLPKNIALGSRCSCGEVVQSCPFWAPVIDELSRRLGRDLWKRPYALDLGVIQPAVEIDQSRQTRWRSLSRSAQLGLTELSLRLGLDVRTAWTLASFRRALRTNELLHDVLRQQSGRRVIIDSTKGFRFGIGQYLLAPQRSRVVLLSRDGRGVMSSLMRSGRGREAAVDHWVNYYRRALPWIERYVAQDHQLRVRYEDVVADPTGELNRILAFLGLAPNDVTQIVEGHEPHILNGNPMRHGAILAIAPDERWRRELSADDLSYFQAHAGDTARQLGYV
jgi:hypothetical protein